MEDHTQAQIDRINDVARCLFEVIELLRCDRKKTATVLLINEIEALANITKEIAL